MNKSDGLNKLSGILDRDPDRFVIVPRNHHIQCTKSETYNDTKEVTEEPELAKKNYQKVLSRFFSRTSPHPRLAIGRRFVLPVGDCT